MDAAIPPALLEAAARTPDPATVRARLERLAGADLGAPGLVATLVPVLANSGFLARYLAGHPEAVAALADLDALRAPLEAATLRAWFAERADPAAGLRHMKHLAFLRITARDVALHAPVPEVCADLSMLADVATDLAVAAARRQVAGRQGPALGPDGAPLRFVVMGMGKLGGRELNYSSDIDLVFFYDRDEGSAGSHSPHEHFTKVGEAATRLLGEPTAEGFVFRVDLRLRPEGRSGPLCNSLPAAERYFETWGRTWERLAWLRARPVGGDLDLGHELLGRIDAWIHPRTADPAMLDAIGELKDQWVRRRQAAVALGRASGLDLKLDPGGIRAVEFFANALQLLYAGRDPGLRDPSTLGALDRLYAAGLINALDHDRLASAYLLYRRVEHRLQMDEERQTQLLPEGATLDALARRLGFADPDPGRRLRGEIDAHRAVVGAMFDDLLTGHAATADVAPEARLLLAPDAADRVEVCRAAGLVDPEQAVHLLAVAGRHPQSPLSPRAPAQLSALGLRLLTEVLRSSEPERALTHLTAFLGVVGGRRLYLETLRERPAVARLLVSVFADSDLLSEALLRRPELIDDLYGRPREPDIEAAVDRVDPGDPEAWVEAVARVQQREVLRVGLADLAGELDPTGVEAALTRLAEAILQGAVTQAARRVPLRGAFGIVAFGKLGGGELSYGSDLDLVFVYEREEDAEAATRLARRVLSLLALPTRAGALYPVDARLRPGGSQGTLVTRLARFVAWHETQAVPWERLALVRARPVTGDPPFRAEVATALERLTYERPPPAGLEREMRRLRRRIEAEVAREGPGRYNPKTGRGGLIDIELIVQALQVRYGGADTSLRTPNTLHALVALRSAGLLDHADMLIEARRFLRRLDHRLRIARGRPVSELRTDRRSLDRLARRLGYRRDPLAPDGAEPGERLLKDYERITVRVREAFDVYFPATGGDDGDQR
jgi:glutamate-ammonia-ligase adenylyltransferase